MTMNRLFDQNSLEHDFADEFVEQLGGIGDSIVRAHERAETEKFLDGDIDDEEESGSDLLSAIEDEVDDLPARKAAPDDEDDEEPAGRKPTAYSKEDAEALTSLSAPQETAAERQLREANERIARLEQRLLAPQAAAPVPAAPQTNKIKPTGNKEVDDYLADAGILDTTPELPREVMERLEQLERQNRSYAEQARMEQRANAMVVAARSKAEQIARVFKDAPINNIAEVIIASGDPNRGLEFARNLYQTAGVLGKDGLPTGHISERKRAPMPHTRGVNGSRPARRTDTGGWTPTNDPAERAKRMANY